MTQVWWAYSHYLQGNRRPEPKHVCRDAHVAAWLDGCGRVHLGPWQLEMAPAAQQVLGGLIGPLAIANLQDPGRKLLQKAAE